MAAATCVSRGARPDIFDHRYSVAECGGTQPKRLKSVEYILLGTLVTNIFPQDVLAIACVVPVSCAYVCGGAGATGLKGECMHGEGQGSRRALCVCYSELPAAGVRDKST